MASQMRARKGDGRATWPLQNGFAIKEFRELLGRTTKSVAEAAGIDPSTLTNYEAERRSASEETLQLIADDLGVNVESIRRKQCGAAVRAAKGPSPLMSEAVA